MHTCKKQLSYSSNWGVSWQCLAGSLSPKTESANFNCVYMNIWWASTTLDVYRSFPKRQLKGHCCFFVVNVGKKLMRPNKIRVDESFVENLEWLCKDLFERMYMSYVMLKVGVQWGEYCNSLLEKQKIVFGFLRGKIFGLDYIIIFCSMKRCIWRYFWDFLHKIL